MSESKGRGSNKGKGGNTRGGSQCNTRGGQGNSRGGGQGNFRGGGQGNPRGGQGNSRGGGQGNSRGGHRGQGGQEKMYGSQPNLFFGQLPPRPLFGNQPMPSRPQDSLLGQPQPPMNFGNLQPGRNPQIGNNPQFRYPTYQPIRMPNYPGQQQPPFGMQATYTAPAPLQPPQPNQEIGAPSAGSAKFMTKHPVTALNEMKSKAVYSEFPTKNDLVCLVVNVDGKRFEGYALTKKDAKKKAAEEALKNLFNIICVEGSNEEEEEPVGNNQKSTKSKPKQKKEEDEEKILNDTLEKLKQMTMPDVNIVREKPPQQQREAQMRKHSESGSEGKDSSAGGEGSQKGNRSRGGRRRRGKGKANALEDVEGMLEDDEEMDSDNESVVSQSSQSQRGKDGSRRGRGRGASSLPNITRNSCEGLDSDNESVGSQSSQSVKVKGQYGRGGRGRRGGKGADSQRTGRNQESDGVTEQPSHEFDDGDDDDDFSESRVFKFLVRTLGGCASVSKFKQEFSPLPSYFDDWIMKPKNRLSIYKRNHQPKFIGPFLIDATVCVDHMGFAKNKRCYRKDCSHFHICNFYLNGWCKRGMKCRQGHTFTKGHNRVVKAKLGLNPFKDAEIKTIIQCRYPQICRKLKCADGDDCPYLHVCFNFIRDKCEDSNCQRGHDLETPHNMWVLSIYQMDKWTKEKLALLKFLINMPRKSGSKKSPDDGASIIDPSECGSNMDEEDFSDDIDNIDEDEDDSSDDVEDEDERTEYITEFDDLRNLRGKASMPKEEVPVVTEKKKLNRKDRWAQPVEDTEFLVMRRKPDTEPCQPDHAPKQSMSNSVLDKDAHKKDICLNGLLGTCQGQGCDLHHTRLPYLWQIRIYGEWVSFGDEENQRLEQSYCNQEDMADGEVDYDERKYRIHMLFKDNSGILYEIIHGNEPLQTNDVLSIRRLSTTSYAKGKKPMSTGSFRTQWRWYYLDDASQWIQYEKDSLQCTLEKKFIMEQKCYLFTRKSYKYKYRIEFACWQQVNMETAKVRRILRRPLFVSLSDVELKSFPPILEVPGTSATPPAWAPWDLAHDFELVDLEEASKEYGEVKTSFFATLREDNFQICNIYRIQNLALWNEYKMKKSNMERVGNVNERCLFHGTDSIDTCYGICTNNFDFRLSGKNATMYGKGSYFAVTSKYSNCYTRGPMRLMLKAKVLIGCSTKGEKDFVCPPNIPGEGHKRYDSCVDDTIDPKVFVVFDRNQSYPEHLIAYRERDDELLNSAPDHAPVAQPMSRPVSLGATAGSSKPVSANAHPGNVQAFSSSAQAYPSYPQTSRTHSSAQASPSYPQTSRTHSSAAAADLSSVQQVYNNPYLSSPTTPPSDLPAPPESRGLSYRTSSGRVQRMSYPERKKEESCSIQ